MVSCLMVSRPGRGRLPWLRRSLAGYVGQTHARRELVVVIDETEPETTAAAVQCISALGRDDIRMIRPQRGLSLGALRNLALDEALGEMFCQWDDDDLHHPRRIAVQAAALTASGAEGACLEQAMHFFAAPRHLYGLNFRTCDSGCLPGTILGWRSAPIAYAEAGEAAVRGEDAAVALALRKRGTLCGVGGQPHLYVYVFHGANTSDEEHHQTIGLYHAQTARLLRHREAALRAELAHCDFGPGPVVVQGRDEPAFVLSGSER